MDSINGISYYLNKCRCYQTQHRWQLFFQEDSALVHCTCNTVQLQQRCRLPGNTAFEWKVWFSCFPVLRGSAEAQVIWGGILKHLFIAYFISNISAKKYQNLFMCVKVIASHRWDVFLRHSVYDGICVGILLYDCFFSSVLEKTPVYLATLMLCYRAPVDSHKTIATCIIAVGFNNIDSCSGFIGICTLQT